MKKRAGAARAEDSPDRRPMLRIEPGMHTAVIGRIGVNAACTLMVTGSEDKTARLWTLPAGGRGSPKLLRTLRVPIGKGDEGKIYAVALSPDGKWVAPGGWTRPDGEQETVYIFEAATGRLVTRLGRLGNVVNHLAFSPDGSRLAAMLFGGEGMRLWAAAGWRLIAGDKEYGGKDSYGAAFDSLNRLYTVAYDGQIRRYGADGRLEAKVPAQGGRRPHSIAVHPNGALLAIGFDRTMAAEVYDAQTLKRLYAADTSGIGSEYKLQNVAWSADGERLYAGAVTPDHTAPPFRFWQDAGKGGFSDRVLSQDSIAQLLPCGDGIAVGAADPVFGLIAVDGSKRVWLDSAIARMRNKLGGAFTLSADGSRVRFGLGQGGERPILFDVAAFRLVDSAENPDGLAPPQTTGLAISDWENKYAPKLDGKPIVLEKHEWSRALAIAPDGSRFVLGADYRLRAYDASGGKLWEEPVPDEAYGVNISRDGRLVAAAYGDGTSAGTASPTGRNCSRCLCTPRIAASLPGRQRAITPPRPAPKTSLAGM